MFLVGVLTQQLVIGSQCLLIAFLVEERTGITLLGFLVLWFQFQGLLIAVQGTFSCPEIIVAMLSQIAAHHIVTEVTTGLAAVVKHPASFLHPFLFDKEGCHIIEVGLDVGS